MAAERKQLILVDGSGYIFRAFHALPPMNTSRGLPTQAVYGFIRMLLKLLKDVRPSHIAIVFDSPKRTFRDDLFADYKANRSEAPNDLIVQIPYIHRAVEAFRIKSLMIEGFEADDVIGTLAKRAAKTDFTVTLITADKDFMQLVGPHVSLWNADPTRDKRTGPREVRERFGVEPSALVDIQALTGDSIDNIKGVPGVGEETGIRGAKRIAGLLAEHRADVDLARKLVRIETDMELKVEPVEFAWQGVDEKLAAELLRELEFNSIIREISPSQADLPGLESHAKPAATVSGNDLADALKTLADAPRIAVDLSTSETGHDAIQLASSDQTIVVEHDSIASAASLLSSERPPKSCHDLKNQIEAFTRHGIALEGVDFDTMLAGFLINSGQGEPSLTHLYHEYLAPLGASSPPGTNADLIRNLREALTARLEADALTSMYNEIEMPIASILAAMEADGIGIDGDALKVISKEFGDQLAGLERECYEHAGRELNLNSPTQLRELLFEELKLPRKGVKKTKSGLSTDADTLEKLAALHPLPRKLLEFRMISKLKSTYADSLSEVIHSGTGRIHTTWHQALVPTGRVSSSDPNLQQIPTSRVEGRRIRRAFVPKPGCVFVSADCSQIYLRVMAHLSADKTLVDAFNTGEDIHVRTATEVLGVTPDQVNAEARRQAKVINFGIIYGMGSQRLAGGLGVKLAEASDYIKRYFERLPGVRAWLDGTARIPRQTGYVTTMYRR